MKDFIIPLAFLCGIGFAGTAEQRTAQAPGESKPAWEWSDEERLAARFAAGAPEARLGRAVASGVMPGPEMQTSTSNGPGTGVATATVMDVIDGSVQPELLLPIELFNDLVLMRYFPEPTPPSDDPVARWREFGLKADPDPALRAATVPMVAFLRVERNRRAVRPSTAKEERGLPEPGGQSYCYLAAVALEKVRATIGEDEYAKFLRLLYAGLAPGRRMFVFEPPAKAEQALRLRARGCR